MAIIYRYTDLLDETIKYVGIVWSGNRTLKQRVSEHRRNDGWCKNAAWRIEYLKKDVHSRTDAEMLEGHYIAKFGTDQFYNVRKNGWGLSDYIDDSCDEWELFQTDEETKSDLTEETWISEISPAKIGVECKEELFSSIRESMTIRLGLESGDVVFIPQRLNILTLNDGYYEVDAFDLLEAIYQSEGIVDINEDMLWCRLVCSEVDGELETVYLGSGLHTFKVTQSYEDYYALGEVLGVKETVNLILENGLSVYERFDFGNNDYKKRVWEMLSNNGDPRFEKTALSHRNEEIA